MKKVVVLVEPFDFQQTIYEFDEDAMVLKTRASLEDLPLRIFQLCDVDNVTDVTIHGAINFTAKVKEYLRNIEITNYGAKTLDIHLVP